MLKNMLRMYRNQCKMSQYELAERANVTRSYITLLEDGKRSNPSYDVMKKIANALGKTVTEVFFPDEIKNIK